MRNGSFGGWSRAEVTVDWAAAPVVRHQEVETVMLETRTQGRRRPRVLRWLFAVGAVLAGVGGGCGDDNGTDPSAELPPYEDGRLTFPLAVGNHWTYGEGEFEARGGSSSAVVGTRTIGGATYSCLVETVNGVTDTSYVRQDGSRVLLYPGVFLREADDPLNQWLAENVVPSLPWRVIDFEATVGETWTVAQAQGEVEVLGAVQSVAGLVTVEALGTRAVSVPAGGFDEAYRFRITQSIAAEVLGGIDTEVRTVRTLLVVDDLGIAREDRETLTFTNGNPGSNSTREALVLQSFAVARP